MGSELVCGRGQGQRSSGVIRAGYGCEQRARPCRARAWPGQGRVGWQTRTWSVVDHSRVDHGAFPTRGEGCGGTIGKGGGVPKRGEDAT